MNVFSQEDHKLLSRESFPETVHPMLATLHERAFDDEDWIFERKLDGVRVIVSVHKGSARLTSRNGKDLTKTYPELIAKIEDSGYPDVIFDGEVVIFDHQVTSFSRLQNRMKVENPSRELMKKHPVELYIFDMLHLAGYATTDLPLRKRKNYLKKLLTVNDTIHFTPHINESGTSYHKEACEKGWEGVIAKKAESTYLHSRSKKWLKLKCSASQELVIGGFTDPEGERIGFGAILVGFFENDELKYAGKVGTGYSDKDLTELRQKFDRYKTNESPFDEEVDENSVHWLEPQLVAEIEFTEWTDEHKLRHPRFKGVRKDKVAKKVVKEQT